MVFEESDAHLVPNCWCWMNELTKDNLRLQTMVYKILFPGCTNDPHRCTSSCTELWANLYGFEPGPISDQPMAPPSPARMLKYVRYIIYL